MGSGRGANRGPGPGESGATAGPLPSWMVAQAPDTASLSLSLSPPLEEGADCHCSGVLVRTGELTVTMRMVMLAVTVRAPLYPARRVCPGFARIASFTFATARGRCGHLCGSKGSFGQLAQGPPLTMMPPPGWSRCVMQPSASSGRWMANGSPPSHCLLSPCPIHSPPPTPWASVIKGHSWTS